MYVPAKSRTPPCCSHPRYMTGAWCNLAGRVLLAPHVHHPVLLVLKAELPVVAALHSVRRVLGATLLAAPTSCLIIYHVHHPVLLVLKAALRLDALHSIVRPLRATLLAAPLVDHVHHAVLLVLKAQSRTPACSQSLVYTARGPCGASWMVALSRHPSRTKIWVAYRTGVPFSNVGRFRL